jgi:septum formation protein
MYGSDLFHKGQADNSAVPIWNKEIQRYYWQDKAGGYGIQDPFGMKAVRRIKGDYYNVVGLPISRLCQVLKTEFGVDL